MNLMSQQVKTLVDWSVATRPLPGQVVSGDIHLVKEFNGSVLVAVIDGVGHGAAARFAAQLAAETLERYSEEPVVRLMKLCHEALTLTRGAAITLATIHAAENKLHWLSVGNVDARLVRARPMAEPPSEGVVMRQGLIGCRLPALHSSDVDLEVGDVLVLVTDGIDPEFVRSVTPRQKSKQIVERVMREHFKGTDDALVLAVRYLGGDYE